ncbi:malto-oligosyltrehalose trehalohydrolase [Aggregatilinea lenta]|uniref:malto-oligosyltrehalose trehalohydrolase n=1 Tax=Aggregatilinea lenta TaxID=913108 RepID=UPI000E5A5938|nr:malto-oligosyltrehalose trehalohydrolase [Aggregatilinea lenta]
MPREPWTPRLGAIAQPDGTCTFRVWAPFVDHIDLHLTAPQERVIPMQRDVDGTHTITADAPPGTTYLYRLGAVERPDPASRFQPGSVHGPSQVVGRDFDWHDAGWTGISLDETILYELHVGTFTPEGTFDAIITHLDALVELGVTALEIMPVNQFPGARDWGYDGVLPFAVQNSYGGPDGLKRLIDACHARKLAVVLDVVYNHFGPEGNYLREFGPYFTDAYNTPWGTPLNFDGPGSDEVRAYFIENALMWIDEFHVDGLRLDATHAFIDFSARTFLEELAATVHAHADRLGRRVSLIAENDRGDDRLLRPPELGGYGLDAQWSDDLHHVLHTLLTGEHVGYYRDFGLFPQLVKALRLGFVYAGDYSPFRERRHGSFRADLPGRSFVVAAQNHDQVGNRMNGDRLSALVPFEALKLAAGIVLLSPYVPLLFMGEEYGETAPFLYFTSYGDPDLGRAVTQGRRKEFKDHAWEGDAPDPQDEATFLRSRLNHDLRGQSQHRALLDLYTALIRLRKERPALRALDKERAEVIGYERERVIVLHRWHADGDALIAAFNLGEGEVSLALPVPVGTWREALHSADARWMGPGYTPAAWTATDPAALTLPPQSFAVFVREG